MPIVQSPSGLPWDVYYAKRDETNGRPAGKYSLDDPRFLLLLFIREWQAFQGAVTPVHSAWAREVRDALNRAAHEPESIDTFTAKRAVETMGLLVSNVAQDPAARAELDRLALELDAPATQTPASAPEVAAPEEPAAPQTPAGAEQQVVYGVPAAARQVAGSAPTPQTPAEPDVLDRVELHNALSQVEDVVETPERPEEVDDRPDLGDGLHRIRVDAGPVTATAIYRSNLNYATANQHLSPLQELQLENRSNQAQQVLSVTVDIEGIGDDETGISVGPVDLSPYETHSLTREELSWALDHQAFAELEEARAGRLELQITVGGVAAVGRGEVTLLARDEWDAANTPELLAAFVTPNQPEITALLAEASDLLQQRTDNPSFVGYQDDEERVIDTAHCIYDAIRARGIRYATPPASFETTGQKVRRPEDVLGERWGTCLDLSVLYASALEAAGINPVIVMLKDHAFAGFLSEEVKLVELATSSKEQIQNIARSGMLVPVELTGATAGQDVTFDAARRSTERYWDQDLDDVRFVLDVAACRRRIRPLPRVRRDGDTVIIEVQRPAAMTLPTTHRPETRASRRTSYPQRVERWRSALLDLSFRNPLLKLSDRGALKLHIPERALGPFEDILSSGQALTFTAGLELQDSVYQGQSDIRRVEDQNVAEILDREGLVHAIQTQERLGKSLDSLRRRAKTVFEETGSNNLFLTLGALRWKDNSGRDALAPLFLLPVHLEGRKGSTYRVISEGDTAHLPNYCLIEKLHRDYEIDIPELSTPPRDDSGIDVPAILQAVRRAMTLAGQPFTVESDVRLAILQFSTLEMWRDVSNEWQRFMSNSVVKHLVETPTETYVDQVPTPEVSELTEAEEHLPVPTDGSQLEAIRWAREGRTFVLEGPPGTGKSQTITNMIANALAHGRTVLFVAEKQAALEVVRRRLDGAGLGPLTLDLHGKDQSIKHVRAQLEQAWDYTAEGDDRYDSARRRLKTQVQDLADYAGRLHQPGPAGISLWQAHERVLHHSGPIFGDFVVPAQVVTGQRSLENVFEAVRATQQSLRTIEGRLSDQPWSLAGPGSATPDFGAISAAVQRLGATRNGLPPKVVELISDTSPTQLRTLVDAVQKLAAEPRLALPQAQSANWAQDLHRLSGELDDYQRRYAQVLPYLTPAAKSANVPMLRANLVAAQNAGALKRGRLLKTATAQIAALWTGMPISEAQVHRFLNDVEQVQRDGQQLFHRFVQTLPGERTPDVEHGGRQVQEMANAVDRWRGMDVGATNSAKIRAYVAAVGTGQASPPHDAQALRAFSESWQGLLQVLGASDSSLDGWRRDRSLLAALDASMPSWAESMRQGHTGSLTRLQTAQADLQRLRDTGFGELSDQLSDGRIPPDGLVELVEAKVVRAVEAQRLDETGMVAFQVKHRNDSIRDLAAAGHEARERARSAIPHLVRTTRKVDTRHPSNDLAALRREFQRKRGGSIRELMTNHVSALLKLTPCLLMSPASVARYIPAESMTFDLVIFDEASQIRVADAVGALGRSRSAVIVGDSQQMPPTSMFRSATDFEEDNPDADGAVVPVDQDSILKECVDSNIERLRLTWHYRSRDESLIAFSNRAYYRDELATFPTQPGNVGGSTSGVHFRWVGGHYDGGTGASRTNQMEADAIVEEISSRLEADPEVSIGVVTLNSQQRDLILDKLEAMPGRVRRAFNREVDPIFVKNLENVQGDERDVILFSLAFSPDPKTGVLRLNFGPVMTDGGERRLNVAITRARHEVVLFSSFQPEDIDLSRTSSVGLRDLRQYLLFARDHGAEDAEFPSTTTISTGHSSDVAEKLRAAGLDVVESLGMSGFKVDLAVRQPGAESWLAVLLDGPGWARRRTASDRDVLPAAILSENMGWPAVERVWLPGWIRNRDAVVQRIKTAAEDVATRPAPDPESASTPRAGADTESVAETTQDEDHPSDAPNIRVASLAGDTAPAETLGGSWHHEEIRLPRHTGSEPGSRTDRSEVRAVPFRDARSDEVILDGALDRLDDAETRAQVRMRLEELVAAEGPIEAQLLAMLVGRSFGLMRVRQARTDELLAMVPDSRRHRDGDHEFIWPDGVTPDGYQLVRVSEDVAPRSIDQISRVELRNAVRHALDEPRGMRRDELRHEVMGLFGFRREGGHIRARLDEAIDTLAANGELHATGGFVLLND
ncbi:DUF4011 domain-containing protein [Flexivirga oryzae]|uniref:DUF4011 domain-containing protein n=1 Tax=Flexivirga oryzae TaxID=1794944 RepID=A0A839MZT8_9MICO|nr:hypothetical protein [Flexivirga oryzae]